MDQASTSTGTPWGWGRMTDRLPLGSPSYVRVELDPVTQCARYYDGAGQVIEMGRHGTSKTRGTASLSGGGDGSSPSEQTQDDNTTDYESD
ncbi:putative ATP-grasp-modified RiPP [Actinomadura harenae]|uniref:Putative ATP-grasp-modified RiPP n=1 Tax=Actinomadura harenae TaxID=2483351 RepID=A0A3M2M2J6_9ACTN|nr:putative ATP-grasp-modified RiPP [Actinomadura harenae]RMI43320.1 putative ATP-grasp-modified RiPP [Actinomadura harenae]